MLLLDDLFFTFCECLINQNSASLSRFCALANLLLFAVIKSPHYFIKFVRFNFSRGYMIVKASLTQCLCTANLKEHICPYAFSSASGASDFVLLTIVRQYML